MASVGLAHVGNMSYETFNVNGKGSTMANKNDKTTSIGLKVSPGMKEALESAAKQDFRTVSNLVEMILAKWLIENGHMKEPE